MSTMWKELNFYMMMMMMKLKTRSLGEKRINSFAAWDQRKNYNR